MLHDKRLEKRVDENVSRCRCPNHGEMGCEEKACVESQQLELCEVCFERAAMLGLERRLMERHLWN